MRTRICASRRSRLLLCKTPDGRPIGVRVHGDPPPQGTELQAFEVDGFHNATYVEPPIPPIQSFALEWDRAYGIDRRSGWTVKIDGRVIVQFARTLPGALWSA